MIVYSKITNKSIFFLAEGLFREDFAYPMVMEVRSKEGLNSCSFFVRY